MHSNFLHIADNFFVANNGVFGVAYKLELPEKYSLSEHDFEHLIDAWKRALMPLNNAVILRQDFFISDKYDSQKWESDNFLQESTKAHFKDRDYLKHYAYIFCMQADFNTYKNVGWYNPFKGVDKAVFEGISNKQEAFRKEVSDAINYITNKKFGNNSLVFTKFMERDFINYEDFYFSGLAQGFTTNVFTEGKKVYTGDKQIGIFSINHETAFSDTMYCCIRDDEYSGQYAFYKSYGENFGFNLKFDHIYTSVFFIDEQAKVRAELQNNVEVLQKSKAWSTQNEVAYKDSSNTLEELHLNDDVMIIRGFNSISFFGDNDKDYERKRELVKSAFNDAVKPHYTSNSDRIKSDFFLSFPTFAPYLNDKQTYRVPVEVACSFLQNTTHYKDDAQGLIFTSRIDNKPTFLDDYFEDKKYDNARNGIIIAPTGYGKSTLFNHKVRYNHERGDKTVIVDFGGSYVNYSKFYPNDVVHISFEHGKSLGYDFFNIAYSEDFGIYENLTATELDRLTDLVILHTGEVYSAVQKEVINKFVALYYSQSEGKSFHGFYDFLVDNQSTIFEKASIEASFFSLSEFLLLLKKFSKTGEFGFLYAPVAESLVDISAKAIVIFEIEQASKNPIILKVLLNLIDIMIDRNILKDKNVRGHIYIDEIAKLYKYDGVIEMVELFYQTVRKKNASIFQVLQAISQLPEGKTALSIIENTQVLYVLNAKNYEPIQKAFNLPDNAVYMMQSLQSKTQGEAPLYTELFVMRGKSFKVVRLELPPAVFWTYQTDGEKSVILLDEYAKTGNDMVQAVKNITQQ